MTSPPELLFIGPADDSAPTLRCIKGVFIADLEFAASDVQRFLDQAPISIKIAESKLEIACDLLRKAGAKVSVIRESEDSRNETTEAALQVAGCDSLSSPFKEEIFRSDSLNEGLELSFDFELKGEPAKDLPGTPSLKEASSQSNQDICSEPFRDLSLDLSLEPTTEIVEFSTEKEINQDSVYDLSLALNSDSDTKPHSAMESLSLNNETEREQSSDLALARGVDIFAPSAAIQPIQLQSRVAQKAASLADSQNISDRIGQHPQLELTISQLKALQRPHRKRLGLAITASAAILGLSLLVILNQWFFSHQADRSLSKNLENQPLVPLENQDQKEILSVKADPLMADSVWFSTEQNLPNRTLNATIWVEKNRPVHGSIQISTPQPATLTKEEIVNNVSPRSWLRTITLKDFVFKQEQSGFIASGPSFAYVTVGNKNIRIAGHGRIKATFSDDYQSMDLEVLASSLKSALNVSESTNHKSKLSFSIGSGEQEGSNLFELHEAMQLTR